MGIIFNNIFKTSSYESKAKVSVEIMKVEGYLKDKIRKQGHRLDKKEVDELYLKLPKKYLQYCTPELLGNFTDFWDIEIQPASKNLTVQQGTFFYLRMRRLYD